MLDAINKGMSFIHNFDYESFLQDDKTQYAVIRAIEILGEASKKIPAEIKKQAKDIPWRDISGMRDVLIHDYFGVNAEVVWKTAKEDLPSLKTKLENLIEKLE